MGTTSRSSKQAKCALPSIHPKGASLSTALSLCRTTEMSSVSVLVWLLPAQTEVTKLAETFDCPVEGTQQLFAMTSTGPSPHQPILSRQRVLLPRAQSFEFRCQSPFPIQCPSPTHSQSPFPTQSLFPTQSPFPIQFLFPFLSPNLCLSSTALQHRSLVHSPSRRWWCWSNSL